MSHRLLRPVQAAVLAAALLTLSGCSSPAGHSASTPVQPTAVASSTPVAEPYAFPIDCPDSAPEFEDYQAVWAADWSVEDCDWGHPSGNHFSDEQLAALDSVGYDHTTTALGFLYARCADLGDDDPPEGYWTSAYAALMLCPDHPDSKAIIARADAALAAERAASDAAAAEAAKVAQDVAQREADLAAGVIIPSGIYRVGETIEPGMYVSEGQLTDCYWEKLDAAGGIRDNAFLTSALRAEVIVTGADYSFSSRGCGEWRKVG